MLATRVLAALVFTPAIFALIWVGGLPLAVTCVILGLLCVWEYLQLVFGRDEPYIKAVALALSCVLIGSILGELPAYVTALFLPCATLLALSAVLWRPEPLQTSMQRVSLALLGVLYGAGLIPYLSRLRAVHEDGLAYCLIALLGTWASDTGAYFCGRFFGKHKLYPTISPAKTVEGGLGGIVCAMLAALCIRYVFDISMQVGHALTLGALAACAGVMGDLCESMLKRSVGAKDSSKLIPGHGGVLDRFDGVMFAVPAVYVYIVVVVLRGVVP